VFGSTLLTPLCGLVVDTLHFPQSATPFLAIRDPMHNAYIIEIQDEAVGIAARDRGGFRFHAAVHVVSRLDGQIFPSVREATRAARAVTVATVRHADNLSRRRAALP
jgi:hypothetical protein